MEALTKAGVMHMSNDVYDEKVYGGARNDTWLIVFVSQIANTNVYSKHADMNRLVSQLLLDFVKTKEGKALRIGFVDTWDGELLKETFDIDMIPSVRLIRGENVYHLKWNKQTGLWTTSDLKEFVTSGYDSAPVETLRRRVQDGMELYAEYIVNTLA